MIETWAHTWPMASAQTPTTSFFGWQPRPFRSEQSLQGCGPVGTYMTTCKSPDPRHPHKPWTLTNTETAVGLRTQTQPLAWSKMHRIAVKLIQKNSKNMAITCFVYIKHISLKVLSIPSFFSLLISALKYIVSSFNLHIRVLSSNRNARMNM